MSRMVCLSLILLLLSSFSTKQDVQPKIDSLYAVLDTATGQELAHTYYVLGSYLMYFADYEDAIRYHLKALGISRKHNDQLLERNVLAHIYYDYLKMDSTEQAQKYNQQLLTESREAGDTANLLTAMSNRGDIFYVKGDFLQVVEQYQSVFELASGYQDSARLLLSLNIIGDAYTELGEPSKALDSYLKALDMLPSNTRDARTVIVRLNLGKTYHKLGDSQKAEDFLLAADKLAIHLSDLSLRVDALKELHSLYLSQKRLEKAQKYFEMYSACKDSMVRKVNDNRMALEIKDAVLRKEAENKLLKKENAISELQLEKQHNWLLMLITGLLGLLACSALVLLLYIRQKRNNKLLVLQNLEIVRSEKQQVKHPPGYWEKTKEQEKDRGSATQDNGLTEEQKQLILDKLLHALYEEKTYTRPDLTLSSLASQIDTNRTYLSQVVKAHFAAGFSALIAKLRVEEARRLLAGAADSQYTIEHIGRMAGFNSKSAFNSAFKRITGITPSFFLREIRQGDL